MTIQKAVLFLLAFPLVMEAATTPAERTLPPTAITRNCPNGWRVFEPSCYYLADTPTKVWYDSRVECQELGSDLAVIETHAENEFIWVDLLNETLVPPTRSVWIGLKRNSTTDVFEWVDGTPFQYSNWKSGEPNNVKGNEDCVFMRKGGVWNDDPCDLNGYSFWEGKNLFTLCEKPIRS